MTEQEKAGQLSQMVDKPGKNEDAFEAAKKAAEEAAEKKGLEQGEQKALLATACNMLTLGIDHAVIAKATGLSVADIKKLKS